MYCRNVGPTGNIDLHFFQHVPKKAKTSVAELSFNQLECHLQTFFDVYMYWNAVDNEVGKFLRNFPDRLHNFPFLCLRDKKYNRILYKTFTYDLPKTTNKLAI